MKIDTPDESFDNRQQLIDELQRFIAQEEPGVSPPCPNCKNHQPGICSYQCPQAPYALTIDPVLYPIEPHILKIVYELNASRLFKTCWSCEGHMQDSSDKLWKIPQVCFYVQSQMYPKLISSYLSKLTLNKVLKYNWIIALQEFSQTVYPTYCLRPDLNNVDEIHLGLLQKDLDIIGTELHHRLKDEARELLKIINDQS